MSNLINNRYRIVRQLGKGGMGTVYLVEDALQDNQLLALKTIRADMFGERSLAQFKYEFAALGQLRHPNLVSVYDFGLVADSGDHFFTMEYVPGQDLSAIVHGTAFSVERLTWLYEVTVQVCRALQYLHSRGFIHYDVKPRNIRVAPQGDAVTVKLMDFGLVGEARGEGQLRVRGTPEYISPELIRGDPVDHRADLYSLGVSLYELVTGRLPFSGDSSIALFKQHLQAAPEPPRQFNNNIPDGLQALILKLLDKEPSNRYSSANMVIQAINELSGLNFPLETKETQQGYIQSGSFVGREFELARLQGLLLRALQGQGQLVFITGAAGAGKTRLAREMRLRAQMQRALVCEGACQEQARMPYHPWISILSQVIAYQQCVTPQAASDFGPALARLMPPLARYFERVEPEADDAQDAAAHKQALLGKIADFTLTCERPLVIIIEDLHYADAETVELLARLGQRASQGRLLLCGLFRDDELAPTHPLHTLVSQAHLVSRAQESSPSRQEQPYELLHLEPLAEQDVAALVRSMLGIVTAGRTLSQQMNSLLPRLMAETGGNPLFVESLMRSLVEEDLMRYDGQTWRIDVDGLTRAPTDIQQATQRRLERIDAETLEMLKTAALIGQRLDMDVLAAACGLEAERVFGLVARAAQRNILTASQPEQQVYRFSNDHIRQAVYAMLSPEQRAERHRFVGETLRRLYDEDSVTEALAWHFEQAGDWPLALHYGKLAADKARRAYANELAIQSYQRVLSILRAQPGLASPTTEYDAWLGLATCYHLTGDRRAQQTTLDELARLAEALGDPSRQIEVAGLQVHLANLMGNNAEARPIAQAALDMAERLGDHKLQADCLESLGEIHYRSSDYAHARLCHERALQLYRDLDDRSGQALCLIWIGYVANQVGQTDEALEHLKQALEIYNALQDRANQARALYALGATVRDYAESSRYYEQALAIRQAIGDKAGQTYIYNNLSVIYWSLGLYDKARDYMEQAVQIQREMQEHTSLAYSLETLGRIYLDLGNHIQAEQAFEEGCALAARVGDRWLEALYHMMLGRAALARQRAARACEWLQTACQTLRELNSLNSLATALAWLGAACLAQGDWEKAFRSTSEAVAHLQATGDAGDYPMQDVWWLHYQTLQAAPPERASELAPQVEACLQRARDAVLAAIATLSDDHLRRNYLNKVKINRAILSEWVARNPDSPEALELQDHPARPTRERMAESLRFQDKLKRVLDISVQMNETHDVELLLNYVMDQVIELSGAERGLLVLVDAAGQMDFKVSRGVAADEPISYSVLGVVAQSKAPVLLQDATTDDRFSRQASVLALNLRSVLCVPLLTRSELVGMIYADNRSEVGRFTQADVDLLSIFANQAATAIDNARLYQEIVRANKQLEEWAHTLEQRVEERTAELRQRAVQLETSSQVGRQVTSILDLDELLPRVVNLIREQFNYYYVDILLAADEQDAIVLRAGTGPAGERLVRQGLRIPLSAVSIVTAVCRSGQPCIVDDVRQSPDYMELELLPDTRSELALPLRAGQATIGVLDIQSDQLAAFGAQDVMVLQTLADQVAIAIHNARLYNEVRRFNAQLEEMVRQRTEELNKAYQTLEKLDKTKSNFIDIAAHELRTPLTLVKGYTQLLETMVANQPDMKMLVEGILSGQTRMHEIINSLLDVSRITSEVLQVCAEPVSIADVIRRVHGGFQQALKERQLAFSTSGLDDLPAIQADPSLLGKVFYHLIVNAIKYTPDGGSITVTGKLVGALSDKAVVEIVVSDTGIGIDPAQQELIFEKFYQTGQVAFHSSGKTKFKGGGPGLGLAIAKGIVLAHHGRIWVESQGYDETSCPGSQFHVVLPV